MTPQPPASPPHSPTTLPSPTRLGATQLRTPTMADASHHTHTCTSQTIAWTTDHPHIHEVTSTTTPTPYHKTAPVTTTMPLSAPTSPHPPTQHEDALTRLNPLRDTHHITIDIPTPTSDEASKLQHAARILHGHTLRQPRIPPLREYCMANHLRAARQLLPLATKLHEDVAAARDDALPLAYAATPMRPEPGWDGPSLATRLIMATRDSELPNDVRATLDQDPTPPHLQATLLRQLTKARYPENVITALRRRVAPLIARLAPLNCPPQHDIQSMIEDVIREIRSRSPIYTWLVIRTWCGAWSTRHRLQQGQHGCVFGCPPPCMDDFYHAARCPIAGRAIDEVRGERTNASECRLRVRHGRLAQLTYMYHKAVGGVITSVGEGRQTARAAARAAVAHLQHLR